MTRLARLLLSVCIFCFITTATIAQTIDYSGTWILNLEKSKLEHRAEGLTGSKFIIKQLGQNFTLTRYHMFGDKQKKLKFKMVADGKTRGVKVLFKGKLEWQGENLKATLSRKNFLNVVDYRFGASTDEFVADEVFKGAPQDHHNIWVFDRQKT